MREREFCCSIVSWLLTCSMELSKLRHSVMDVVLAGRCRGGGELASGLREVSRESGFESRQGDLVNLCTQFSRLFQMVWTAHRCHAVHTVW